METPLISIIVPVYNVEKYLEQTITSVINQENPDWELILVDDGSTDKSGEICDLYAAKDDRIKVFHIENQGVSNARNLGIKNAVGEYIQFLDSDDLLEPDTLNYITENHNVDLFIYGFKIFPKTFIGNTEHKKLISSLEKHPEKFIELDNRNLINSPCNKFYRRKIINDNHILFDVHFSFGEDLLFNLEYLKYCNEILILPYVLYNYRIEDEHGLHARFHKNIFSVSRRIRDEKDKFFNYNKQISERASIEFVESILSNIKSCVYTETIKKKEKIQLINSWINDEYFIKNYNHVKDKLNNNSKFIKNMAESRRTKTIYIAYSARAVLSYLIHIIK